MEASNPEAPMPLLSPFKLGPYDLPNRMVMAPLTRNRAGASNIPGPLNAEYYEQRSSAGLIITEASQISPQGVGYPSTPGIHSSRQVEGWQKVVEGVHRKGGRIFLQLWHVGRISHPSLQPDGALPVAPSAIRPAGDAFTNDGLQPFVTPRALETEEIPLLVDQYRDAARNALEAGFDGVELHAANGYLLDQFLRDGSNQRSDAYGGSIDKRIRLLLEVTETISSVWSSDCIGVRISPLNPFNDMHDSDPEATFSYVAKRLNDYDLAYLHVVEGAIGSAGDPGPAFDLRILAELFTGPYMVNGDYDRERGNAAVASGHADLVSFGRLFLANPDLPERFANDAPLNTPDPETFYGGDARGYTDYPFLQSG